MGNGGNEDIKSTNFNDLNKIVLEKNTKEQQDNFYYDNDEEDDNKNRYIVKGNDRIEKPNGVVIIYGFLKKQSKYIKLWKGRFFILTNHYLFAFTGIENDADCTMALDLSTILSIEDIEEKVDKEDKENIFVVRCPSIKYFFKAENEQIKKKWMFELQKLVKIYKNRMVQLI